VVLVDAETVETLALGERELVEIVVVDLVGPRRVEQLGVSDGTTAASSREPPERDR
jgi:hypothetical protein